MPEGLLDDIKNYLDITWHDQAGEKKLSGMIQRGMSYINDKGGAEFDYSKEEKPRELLFNYVMYERSGVLNEFFIAYLDEIIALNLNERVKNNAEN